MANSSCYIYYNGSVAWSSRNLPCGRTNSTNPNVPCCWQGDTCLSDGICQYTNGISGTSGFYAAGCTDDGFGSGCRRLCTDSTYADIVYDPVESIWHCCDYPIGGQLNCKNATSTRFLAPAPGALATIQFLPESGTPTYLGASASNTAGPSAGPPPPAAELPSSSGGLSTRAAAGIGIGAALGAVALGTIASFLIYRHRKKHKSNPYATFPETKDQMETSSFEYTPPLGPHGFLAELSTKHNAAELETPYQKP